MCEVRPRHRVPGAGHVATINFEILEDSVFEEISGLAQSMRLKGCENRVEDMEDYAKRRLTNFRIELVKQGVDRKVAEKQVLGDK